MFQRPSVVQPTSSAIGNGLPLTKTTSATSISANIRDQTTKRSISNSTLTKEEQGFNTDELFTKHTVAEIKAIQNRLRIDADAKKEELRQMVGERYRDLLQASSSIISIAGSSKRVVEALEESRVAINSQVDPPLPKTTSVASVQDRHLHALQILAAHMKLLLDAPEHLWRLIERKKFFPAAWLFLLARVIHHALVRSDEQDDETWKSQGVDVLAEFPLIQRQWEVVSHFRSQIIHKATLWLRDASSSVEDVCATLVTLHLLDSRPLHDTLDSAFSQRSKTLSAALAAKNEAGPSIMSPSDPKHSANGRIVFSFSQDTSTSSLARPRIREVKESLYNALTIISQTMHIARGVFDGKSGPSLIERVLEFIQSDVDKSTDFPHELHLTTQTLLTNVTSTAHFQLLPRNLQSYKPYVDLTSSSTSLRQERFLEQLNSWFRQSIKLLQDAVERWFEELETVKEVWSVRIASRKWINVSTLEQGEKAEVLEMVDQICRERVVKIWRSTLKTAAATFETSLEISLRSIGSGELDMAGSVNFLFNTVPLPVISQPSATCDIPLKRYQSSLKQQLLGRTALLDGVLSTLEQCAKCIHEEFSFIRSGSQNETRSIIDLLTKLHEPAAEELTKSSLFVLESAVNQIQGNDDGSIRKLVFLGQITEDLASRSCFVEQIGCGKIASDTFVERLDIVNNTVLNIWKHKTVSRIINETSPSLRVIPTSRTGPDPELVQALMTLYEALQEVMFRWDRMKQMDVMRDTLKIFIETWLSEEIGHEQTPTHNLALLMDLIAITSGPKEPELMQKLEKRLGQIADSSKLRQDSSEYVKRLQTFLPVTIAVRSNQEQTPSSEITGVNLTADKFPNLLRYGSPLTEPQVGSDSAKPGPRFGLLLVGGEGNR